MKKSGYDFYLNKCLLPIAPEKLQISINNANDTITLINEGEINVLKTAGLTEIEFECRIPQIQYPFSVYQSGFKGASYFLDYFESLKVDKKPFQFIVSRTLPSGKVLFSTNMKVSLEDYKITEQASDGFDLMVKIKLKQYRNYGTKTVSIRNVEDDTSSVRAEVTETRASESSPETPTAQTYVVVKGDCLYTIARKFYGDGAKYIAIYEANREVIGGNPNLIYPGQVLTIPSAPAAASVAASINARNQQTGKAKGGFSGGAAGTKIHQISMQ